MATIIELRPDNQPKQKINLNGLPLLRPKIIRSSNEGIIHYVLVAIFLGIATLFVCAMVPFIIFLKVWFYFKNAFSKIRYRFYGRDTQ